MTKVIEGATSYGLGALLMSIDPAEFAHGFCLWGGVVLLIARLCVDVPRAVRAIKNRWRE